MKLDPATEAKVLQACREGGTMPPALTIDCPGLIVVSEANRRDHWAKRLKRKNAQQLTLHCYLAAHTHERLKLPAVITFVKIGSRKLDSDNLAGAFKGCRDYLAKWLHMDDGDERLTWEYRQEKGKPAGIRIEIQTTPNGEA